MEPNVSTLERAFQLAATGLFSTVSEIKLKLMREGYRYELVEGPLLTKRRVSTKAKHYPLIMIRFLIDLGWDLVMHCKLCLVDLPQQWGNRVRLVVGFTREQPNHHADKSSPLRAVRLHSSNHLSGG